MVELKPPEQAPEPPELNPPDSEHPVQSKGNLYFTLLVVVAVFLLLDLAILAYWLWPDREQLADEPRTEVATVIKTTPSMPEKVTPPVPADGQLKAEEAQGTWLRRQAEGRGLNIENWGDPRYEEALATGAEGDQLMTAADFPGAADAYLRATEIVSRILAGKADLLGSLLEQGAQALEAVDAGNAEAAFRRALALDSQNQQALEGARRASTLDKVADLVGSAEGLEATGDLIGAAGLLQEAQNLDPVFVPARVALERVQAKRATLQLAEAMGRFYAHLKAKSFSAATLALEEAEALRPDDQVISEARYQLKSAREADQLSRLSATYQQHREDEHWQAALETAEQALKIDPELGFALQGRLESTERLALDKGLQRVLNNPSRLQDDGPYAEARALLAAARAIPSGGMHLQQQINTLDRLLIEARLEVKVMLRSDALTEVVIYRVGRLGRFLEKTVELRPGEYTVVGTRPGFRNIRRILQVSPATLQPAIVIRCEEPI